MEESGFFVKTKASTQYTIMETLRDTNFGLTNVLLKPNIVVTRTFSLCSGARYCNESFVIFVSLELDELCEQEATSTTTTPTYGIPTRTSPKFDEPEGLSTPFSRNFTCLEIKIRSLLTINYNIDIILFSKNTDRIG